MSLGRNDYIVESEATGGNADVSSVTYAAWDATALYLFVDVEDQAHNATLTDELLWSQDSIQVAMDVDADGDDQAYLAEDFEFGVTVVTGAGGGTFLARWSPAPAALGAATGFAADARRNGTQNKTVYELRIPFTTLGLTAPPAAGTFMGFSFIVNDDDAINDAGGPREGWLEWTPGIGNYKQPSAFGVLVFTD